MLRAAVIRRWAGWLCVDEAVAVVEKVPAMRTICFDPTAAFMQQRMVGTAQQHEIRQLGFSAVGPVLNVVAVDIAAVGATRKSARAIAQPQCAIDGGRNRPGFAANGQRLAVQINVRNHHAGHLPGPVCLIIRLHVLVRTA